MTKKGICELCGFADDSYTIEENGAVMKVCKFCHDGYLERMGLPPDADKPVADVTLTLDLDSADDIEEGEADLGLKVEPLSEEELKKILRPAKKREGKTINQGRELSAAEEVILEENKTGGEALKKSARKKAEILAAVNPRIDDERIKITSPEVSLLKDARPKTNLDVAISEYEGSVKFIDSFKYVFHRVIYAVFLGVITLAVATVLAITTGWQACLITLGGGAAAVALSFLLMWYLSSRIGTDRRACLLRIRQQEILFKSMTSECYRELKTKYTVLKALGWLLNKLTVLLPLVTIVACAAGAVIAAFLWKYWIFSIVLFGAIVAGIFVYWMVRFAADLVSYKLDIERNQQIQQQTLLDMLKQIKK